MEEEELIKTIADCALKLGWAIAFPSGGDEEDDGMVHGLIVGETEYVNYVLSHME